MEDIIRVELPLKASSKVLSNFKTIGDLEKAFPKLQFVKYIYLDPEEKKLKGVNPPKNAPIVKGAYITVVGEMKEVIKFSKAATRK